MAIYRHRISGGGEIATLQLRPASILLMGRVDSVVFSSITDPSEAILKSSVEEKIIVCYLLANAM